MKFAENIGKRALKCTAFDGLRRPTSDVEEDGAAEGFKFHLRRIIVVTALGYSANGAFSRSDTIRTLTATRSALVGKASEWLRKDWEELAPVVRRLPRLVLVTNRMALRC